MIKIARKLFHKQFKFKASLTFEWNAKVASFRRGILSGNLLRETFSRFGNDSVRWSHRLDTIDHRPKTLRVYVSVYATTAELLESSIRELERQSSVKNLNHVHLFVPLADLEPKTRYGLFNDKFQYQVVIPRGRGFQALRIPKSLIIHNIKSMVEVFTGDFHYEVNHTTIILYLQTMDDVVMFKLAHPDYVSRVVEAVPAN